MYNTAAFKARTKARAKFRDKRVASVSSDNWPSNGCQRADLLSPSSHLNSWQLEGFAPCLSASTSPTCLLWSCRSELFVCLPPPWTLKWGLYENVSLSLTRMHARTYARIHTRYMHRLLCWVYVQDWEHALLWIIICCWAPTTDPRHSDCSTAMACKLYNTCCSAGVLGNLLFVGYTRNRFVCTYGTDERCLAAALKNLRTICYASQPISVGYFWILYLLWTSCPYVLVPWHLGGIHILA